MEVLMEAQNNDSKLSWLALLLKALSVQKKLERNFFLLRSIGWKFRTRVSQTRRGIQPGNQFEARGDRKARKSENNPHEGISFKVTDRVAPTTRRVLRPSKFGNKFRDQRQQVAQRMIEHLFRRYAYETSWRFTETIDNDNLQSALISKAQVIEDLLILLEEKQSYTTEDCIANYFEWKCAFSSSRSTNWKVLKCNQRE